jgi:hypothetical protein
LYIFYTYVEYINSIIFWTVNGYYNKRFCQGATFKLYLTENGLNWFEISVNEIARAKNFYEVPKTLMSETAGYMAFVIDEEGNKVALHQREKKRAKKRVTTLTVTTL